MLPDVEAAVVEHLNADSNVTALSGGRCYGNGIPRDATYPLITVTRIGGPPVVESHFDAARIQVDVYADTKPEAWDLTAAVVASFSQIHTAVLTAAVVTGAAPATGPAWLPHPRTEQPRYTFDMTVWAHPHP